MQLIDSMKKSKLMLGIAILLISIIIPVVQAIECSLMNPCTGDTDVPYTDKSVVRSVCENNVCVQKTTNVECTRNSACGGNTPICDALLHKCVSGPSGGGIQDDQQVSQPPANDISKESNNNVGIIFGALIVALSIIIGFIILSRKKRDE